MVIDDSPSVRRIMGAVLAGDRYEVVGQAESGGQAVELAAQLRPDLVLLDLSLPDGDGSAFLQPLIDAAPGTRVVIMSAADEAAGAALVGAGAAGFIPKGLAPGAFLARLASILGATA